MQKVFFSQSIFFSKHAAAFAKLCEVVRDTFLHKNFTDSLFTAPLQDNMANPKEKTPMCLVNELARFNRIQPQYKLLNERGPAHAKVRSQFQVISHTLNAEQIMSWSGRACLSNSHISSVRGFFLFFFSFSSFFQAFRKYVCISVEAL